MSDITKHEHLRLSLNKNSSEEVFSNKHTLEALEKFLQWCESQTRNGDLPVRSRTYAALVTLNRLKTNYDLDRQAHTTSSGAQVKTQTPHNVSKILTRFGEERSIPAEAGRTSRGSLRAVEELLEVLEETQLETVETKLRKATIIEMMKHLVWVAGEYHERARLEIEFNPTLNASQLINNALDLAEHKAGAVAQHLVGAKLQIRLPDITIPNYSASTADIQTGRRGDFEINDTVFHVTVAPNDAHYVKCANDVKEGYRVYLLVRENLRVAAEQTAHVSHSDKIQVQSIESFIGQNLDELSEFSKSSFKKRFRNLLELYNKRVDAVESDKSLLIEIPENLRD